MDEAKDVTGEGAEIADGQADTVKKIKVRKLDKLETTKARSPLN
jgi:hypothetical protein